MLDRCGCRVNNGERSDSGSKKTTTRLLKVIDPARGKEQAGTGHSVSFELLRETGVTLVENGRPEKGGCRKRLVAL